jgi:peptidoglycan lytic transglycosylase
MRRFRTRRRRIAVRALPALALLPSVAITMAATDATAAKASRATLKAGTSKVPYGHSFRLSGAVPGAAPSRVVIDYRRLGGRRWVERRHLDAGPDGRYSTPLTARRSGVYRARSAAGRPSRTVDVAVASRVRARAERSVLAGHRATVRGSVRPDVRGRRVVIHVGGRTLGARTDGHGRFRARWTAAALGRYRVRAVVEGDGSATRGGDRAGRVTVFRRAVASWYGPGLYGNGVACGGTLQPSTLGVAHRTLPCGTKVTLRYRGRQVTVPVIDRGPYVAGRDYDLTGATRARLHFTGGVGTLLSSR